MDEAISNNPTRTLICHRGIEGGLNLKCVGARCAIYDSRLRACSDFSMMVMMKAIARSLKRMESTDVEIPDLLDVLPELETVDTSTETSSERQPWFDDDE